ncbi:carcinine hydrolase/isopenicillin-N N-acyltransferase family protein [Bacteroides ihuae]|uniref:carcinine hydrolase/isopenicillin-N N-acyltransferase family protein n=1 Tax=Bacteroides ihuae TaxID=1852362 RepID=UPI0008D9381A|nr:carcinine hydrolase/isopenicillin-N N-acyltransferase family protein [Bacteroides ihuae]
MRKNLLFIAIMSFFLALAGDIQACTSAVISGKVTPDGRPLLWKNRDTDYAQNSVKYFSGKRYSFVAVVNSRDNNPREIWIGTNSAGFSIMNTQSYNLEKIKKNEERGSANGSVMTLALEVCATVDDFKHFLDSIKKPSMIEANFGVIDAKGGAAMFEVGYYKYTFYDANNPKDAPCGYIARTNFSFAGEVNNGAGYVRYMQEDKLLMPASATKEITPAWIFRELSRSFANSLLGIDLKSGNFNRPKTTGWFVDQDFIARKSTSCSVVVQGVKKDENAELTTMWTVLGYPPVSVVLPVWVKGGEYLPTLLTRDNATKVSPLCDKAVTLRDRVFSYTQGMGSDRYFNWELLYNEDKTGYMQRLAPVEEEIFNRTIPKLTEWRMQGRLNLDQMTSLYSELDHYVAEKYKELFAL